jgi:hypothetical protein
MLYVLLGVAIVMSFVAGVECVALVICKKKNRKLRNRYDVLTNENHVLKWELETQRNREDVIKEVAE